MLHLAGPLRGLVAHFAHRISRIENLVVRFASRGCSAVNLVVRSASHGLLDRKPGRPLRLVGCSLEGWSTTPPR
jgi:hypothetical protein